MTSSPWSGSPPPVGPGGPGAGPAPVPGDVPGPGASPPDYVPKNDLTYLIDGVTTFQRASALMADVTKNANGQGWVHMRFWECVPETTLEPGVRFVDRIAELAHANNEVRLILWKPSAVESTAGADFGTGATNARCKKVLEAIDPVHIKVELVEHPDNLGSLHTKTMIFCNGDGVRVIVGGLNMADRYRNAPPHSAGTHWHDAAVEFWGPATQDVEKNFSSRWPGSAGAVKGPRAAPPAGAMDIAVKTTTGATSGIRDELHKRIADAAEFVYLENFGIHDSDLINLLMERINIIRITHRPFTIILLVPDPARDNVYGWLHYVTYCALSIASSSAVTYDDNGVSKTVTRLANGTQTWEFDPGWLGPWYEDSEFTWDNGHTNIRNITNFADDTPLYKLVYCTRANPAAFGKIVVHSKVAIIDDKFADVGSANFNPRSLNLDEELSAFITSGADKPVLPLRRVLWDEHFPGSGGAFPPNTWHARAIANEQAAAAGKITVGQPYVLPIKITEYSKKTPTGFPANIFDNAKAW
jgi:phosphatidylserine/phosphatidylglycerophosphate/cardiolipin synthase-like enzyme